MTAAIVEPDLSRRVVGAAIAVHRELGPGLLESTYEECLCCELSQAGIVFERQVPLPVTYKSVALDCGYRLDIVVEDLIIVELKSVERVTRLHEAQLMTYLRLSRKRLGLLINFNETQLIKGVVRRVL